MNVIVFGGSGFLGSHVADILAENKDQVTIYDLKTSPYLKDNQKMIVGDILDANQVQEAVKGQDCVYNFAGLADLDDAKTKPLDTLRFNVLGNLNIMEAAVKAKVKRLIYASSIYVYSQKGGFYRCSKQASEIYIEEYQRKYGLDFTIIRYGTLYGPRADERNSIFGYLKQALENKCIICTNAEDIRDYINVYDAARLSVEVMKEDYKNQHIIVSGNQRMKVREMVMMIKEILGNDIKVQFSDDKSPDHYEYTPYSFVPKIGKKLVNHLYLDIGQGLLECLHEMHAGLKTK